MAREGQNSGHVQEHEQPLPSFRLERPRGRDEPFEPLQVDRVRIDREPVARRARHQHIRAEKLAQRRDRVLERRPRRPRRMLPPELVDEHVGRDDLVRAQEQRNEHCTLPLSTELERLSVGSEHLERTQDPKLEHTQVVASSRGDYETDDQSR